MTTPKEEYSAYQVELDEFRERLEVKSKKLGYKDADERWEKECEIQQAKEEERLRNEGEPKRKTDLEKIEINEVDIIENAEELKEVKGNSDLQAIKINEMEILENAKEPKKPNTKAKATTKKAKINSAKKFFLGCFCM